MSSEHEHVAVTNPSPASRRSDNGGHSKRVAVIGVHGVAHHDPGATANAMADLLLSLPPYDPKNPDACNQRPPREFNHFDSTGLQIPLRPVCPDGKLEPKYKWKSLGKALGFLQEGSSEFARSEIREGMQRGSVGRKFSVKLLQDYRGGGEGNAYITTRLDGRRAKDSTEVHIYEMFWADLARPTNSTLSFFLALFQLILHVPSLSRLAIDTRPDPDWTWKTFQSLHRYASRMLQIVLPMAKVMLLIVLAAAIPAVTKAQNLRLLCAVIGGVLLAAVGFLVMNGFRLPRFSRRISWVIASFLPALTLGATIFVLVKVNLLNEVFILSIAIWALGTAFVWWVLNAYQNLRAGIWVIGWLFYAAALVLFWSFAARARGWDSDASYWIQQASFWSVQWLLSVLRWSWILLAAMAILASLFGAISWRRTAAGPDRAKARAAVRTSRFALALPAFLFMFVTSFIWAGLFSVAQKINEPFFAPDRITKNEAPHPHWRLLQDYDLFPRESISHNFPDDCETKTPICSDPKKDSCSCAVPAQADYLRGVLAWSVGYGSYLVVLVVFAGLILLVWWALPSVLTERFPPRMAFNPRKTEPPRSSNNRESLWMGTWTSRGLDSISLVTVLTWVAIFLIPFVFFYVGPIHYPALAVLRIHSNAVTKGLVCRVIAVAGTAAVLAALVRYSSEILRVILDVDTYLRIGPRWGTPRARIFERYVSLLRHIAKFKGEGDAGYDRVVIVAHSLGSLISGDLLNLLHHQSNDPELEVFGFGPSREKAEVPILLFTMGNPLRQLLNRFFPYLYDWVRQSPDNGTSQLPSPLATPPPNLDANAVPKPDDLGVEKWVNAYRSGDYVGRSLWLDEWYRRTTAADNEGIYPEEVKKIEDPDKTRVEFCIGAGAHTHYWDDTAPDVALQLDELIGT